MKPQGGTFTMTMAPVYVVVPVGRYARTLRRWLPQSWQKFTPSWCKTTMAMGGGTTATLPHNCTAEQLCGALTEIVPGHVEVSTSADGSHFVRLPGEPLS